MKKLISITTNEKKINSLQSLNSDCLVIGINEDKKLNDVTKVLNTASSGSIKKLIDRQELTGELKNQLYLPELNGFKANKVYFIGLGKKNKELNEDEFSTLSTALSKISISANSRNIDIAKLILKIGKKKLKLGKNVKIKFVKDRPGHDFRYALNSNKIKNNLKWKAKTNLTQGIFKTVEWYLNNQNYFKSISKKLFEKRLGNKW